METILETYEARALELIYRESMQIQKQIAEHQGEIQKLQSKLVSVNSDLTGYTAKLSGRDDINLELHEVSLDSETHTLKIKDK